MLGILSKFAHHIASGSGADAYCIDIDNYATKKGSQIWA